MTDIFSRSLFLFAAGILATVLIWAHPGFALAQDAADEDVSAQPNAVVPNIAGCWQGTAFNDSQGNTSILFFFAQKKNKISKKHSTIDLENNVPVHGPIIGTVTPTGFKFHGHVAATGITKGCNIKGTGTFQTQTSLEGSYQYVGFCFEHQFTSGEFSNVNFLGATCP